MKVKDMESFKRIMRLNEWETNPLSLGFPGNAIAGRSDLAQGERFLLDGAIDAKVTSMELARNLLFEAVNGPTTQGNPPFDWAKYPDVAHHGQPQVFNFTWIPFGSDPSVRDD